MNTRDLDHAILRINNYGNVSFISAQESLPVTTFNANFVKKIAGVKYCFKGATEPEDLVVVVSVPTSNKTSFIENAIKSEELLLSKNIPSTFNHIYLSRASTGNLFSIYTPHGDMVKYLNNSPTFPIERLRYLTLQILMAVNEYHSKNLVHRDIKFENFLVYKYGEHINLKLSDHDDIIEVNNDGFALSHHIYKHGTIGYRSRELKAAQELKFTPSPADEKKSEEEKKLAVTRFNEKKLKAFAKINWKSNDCFAVGYMLFLIYKKNLPRTDRNYCELEISNLRSSSPVGSNYPENFNPNTEMAQQYRHYIELINGLINRKIKERITIADALKSKFLGEYGTREYNVDICNRVASYNLEIDNYPVIFSNACLDDAFYLLPLEIKKIYQECITISRYHREFNSYLDTFSNTILTVNNYKIIQTRTSAMIANLQSLDKSRFTPNLASVLHDVANILTVQLDKLTNAVYSMMPIILKNVIEISIKEYHMSIGFNPNNPYPGIFGIQQTHTNIAAALILDIARSADYGKALQVVTDFVNNPLTPLFNRLILKNLEKVLPVSQFQFNNEINNVNEFSNIQRMA